MSIPVRDVEELFNDMRPLLLKAINDAVANVVLTGVQVGVPSNVAYIDRGQTFSQPQTFAAGLVSYSTSTAINESHQGVYALHEANPVSNDSTGFAIGTWMLGQIKSGNVRNFGAVVGGLAYGYHYGTGTVSTLAGIIASARVASTGTGDTVAGGLFGVQISAAGTINYGIGVLAQAPVKSAGTITTTAGVHIENQGLSGITTSYGLRLNSQSGSTNPYAIYSEGGISYHAGNFGIGDTSADSGLEIGAMSGAGFITFNEISDPSSPAADKLALYAKDNGAGITKLYMKDHAGTVTDVSAGSGGSSGKLAQAVVTQTSSVTTTTTTMPYDNTKPQNTEGVEVMTRSITPTNASSLLKFTITVQASHSAISGIIVALFQDTTADALAEASVVARATTDPWPITFQYTMTAGTTSSTTFKVRAGGNIAGTLTVNGQSGSALFNGTMISSIVIEEITP